MIDLDALRKQVAMLSDEALLEVDRDDLVEAARQVYEDEAASRGIGWPLSEEGGGEGEDGAEGADPGEELVSIALYETVEEARFARALLANEGIPVWFAGELSPAKMTGDPKSGLELVTLPEHLDQALEVLQSEVSEEELARQAEEAGEELEEEEDEAEEETKEDE
jgi:hypothetical protein